MKYTGVWTIGEQRHGDIQIISYELLARGRRLADKLGVKLVSVIAGPIKAGAEKELIARGSDEVIVMTNPELAQFLPEPYLKAFGVLIEKYKPEIVLAGATSMGRTLMPLLSIKCHAGLTADCTELEIEEATGNLLQVRPAIGGNIMATIKSPEHRPQMATVRPKSTKMPAADPKRKGTLILETVDGKLLTSKVKLLAFRAIEDDSSNIQEADAIIAGGRGLKKSENFDLIRKIASLSNASVGASRDAVDRGWASYPQQIGLSGKTVSPKFYLCAGISGSVQHIAGIKTAETIVAINNNPEAAIFKLADLGIVADLFEVLPRLAERLEKSRGSK